MLKVRCALHMAGQMKDYFRSSLANYSSHLRQVRKIGMPPVMITKVGWTL